MIEPIRRTSQKPGSDLRNRDRKAATIARKQARRNKRQAY